MSNRAKAMSKQEARRGKRRRKQLRGRLIWGLAGVGVVTLIVVAVLAASRPPQGQRMPIEGADHVEVGGLPARVGAEPPTSGTHYDQPAQAGFYEEAVEDGYLIHSLEHGYVVISYNCDGVSASGCDDLKDNVSQMVEEFDTFKVIGMPRDGMTSRVALTSWGQIDTMDGFDEDRVRAFISTNRGRAPEPDAP
jgi:hypothetical protein